MFGRRTLGRAVFFGLGYLAGTRAGRERYAQIESGARSLVTALRARYGEGGGEGDGSPSRPSMSSSDRSDPYGDIRLG